MELSIILPYHNEGQVFIQTAIDQINETIDVSDYEIIVVDDFSTTPLRLTDPRVRYVRQLSNKGVGQAFDLGVTYAQSDNLFLAGCDIRYVKNGWASKIIKEIKTYPKAFTCTSVICLNAEKPENMDMSKRRLISVVNGATIILWHDKLSNHRMTATFRGLLEAQWLPFLKNRDIDSFEIPCVLGAAYGVSKQWYNYVDGWTFHKQWGTLEPYISLKSWMFGGSCRTVPRIEVGHIFKRTGTHSTSQEALLYNKMLVVTLLFDDYNKLIQFLGTNPIVERARKMYEADLKSIIEKKMEYRDKIVYSLDEFFTRWKIDQRK